MRNIWTIASREYKRYFISPVAYAVAFLIFIVVGILFYVNILAATTQQYAPGIQVILGPLVTLTLFTTPAITMATLSEEQKSGTLELLLTSPVRDYELVVGKWFGGVLFVLTIYVVTWIYPVILNKLVSPGIDQGVLVTGYLGLLLMACTILAIGVAASSLFSNQIAAFFTCLAILLALWMIGYPAQAMGAGKGELLRYLSINEHFYQTFYQGIIDLKDIVYYVSMTALALFLGTMSVETRRWR
jgi:ABC-2 type transport system permease protein